MLSTIVVVATGAKANIGVQHISSDTRLSKGWFFPFWINPSDVFSRATDLREQLFKVLSVEVILACGPMGTGQARAISLATPGWGVDDMMMISW